MKCGSCRANNADNYIRIKEDNNLFEVLKKINSRRTYNSKHAYFCNVCINLAKTKLSQIVSTMSDQNATLNVSTLSNATNTSESSKDEYDYIVMSKKAFSDTGTPIPIPQNRSRLKRPLNDAERQKPCPKRYKKPLVPIQLENVPQTSLVQHPSSQQKSRDSTLENEMFIEQNANPVSLRPCPKRYKNPSAPIYMSTIPEKSAEDQLSQPQSSESISVSEMLLNVEHEASSSESDARQSPTHLQQDLDSLSSKNPSAPSTIPEDQLSQPRSNESILLNDMILNVEHEASSSESVARQSPTHLQQDSESLSSKDSPNQRVVTSNVQSNRSTAKSRPQTVKTQSTVRNNLPKTLLQYDSDSDSDEDMPNRQTTVKASNPQIQQRLTVPSLSAPAIKNPRVRQNTPSDLRQLFSANFNVNNYSRSLAG